MCPSVPKSWGIRNSRMPEGSEASEAENGINRAFMTRGPLYGILLQTPQMPQKNALSWEE